MDGEYERSTKAELGKKGKSWPLNVSQNHPCVSLNVLNGGPISRSRWSFSNRFKKTWLISEKYHFMRHTHCERHQNCPFRWNHLLMARPLEIMTRQWWMFNFRLMNHHLQLIPCWWRLFLHRLMSIHNALPGMENSHSLLHTINHCSQRQQDYLSSKTSANPSIHPSICVFLLFFIQ